MKTILLVTPLISQINELNYSESMFIELLSLVLSLIIVIIFIMTFITLRAIFRKIDEDILLNKHNFEKQFRIIESNYGTIKENIEKRK